MSEQRHRSSVCLPEPLHLFCGSAEVFGGEGEAVKAAIVERLDGSRTEHREVVMAPRLVPRGTTGAAPDPSVAG